MSSRRWALAVLAVSAVPMIVVGHPGRAQAANGSLTLVIDTIVEIDHPDDSIGSVCWGDYVFTVEFGGSTTTSPEFSNDPPINTGCVINTPEFITIGFAVTRTVDTSQVATDLKISVKDNDFIGSDTMDVSPVVGETTLHLSVDPASGAFSLVGSDGKPVPGVTFPGGVTTASITGNGDSGSSKAGLDIKLFAPGAVDTDADGLLDAWETLGFDADGDGTVDVNLPGMGASSQHKDLFLELDTANGRNLGRDDIKAMKDAFAAAPLANPDGTTGIRLWVDTGSAVDPQAREGQALGTCSDGIDNGGDGAADANDTDCAAILGGTNPYLDASTEDAGGANCTNGLDDDGDGQADGNDADCLVGDNLGGGNAITGNPAICNLNPAYFTAKSANFATARLPIFRYAISTPGTATCNSGGQAEIGGNDLVDHNGDGGTIMHELGHTLTLRHGGFEDLNCKPNDVSVMSYFSQFGVGRNGGGVILDYAPPRQGILNGARSTDLPTSVLDEAALSETTPVDSTDPSNRFVFSDGGGTLRWSALNSQPDWDGDGSISGSTVSANIDRAGSTGFPATCTDTTSNEVLHASDEWAQVTLPFRQFGDSASGAFNATPDDEPTTAELQGIAAELTTTDVVASAVATPDPVGAGAVVTIQGTLTNAGRQPADAARIDFTPDPRLTPVTLPAGCSAIGGQIRCALGSIGPGSTRMVPLQLQVPADLVAGAGGPLTVPVGVRALHVGPDPNSGNDAVTVPVNVVSLSDLSVDAVRPDLDGSRPTLRLVVGRPKVVELVIDTSNAGPSSPVNAVVTVSATGAHLQSTPKVLPVSAVKVGQPQRIRTSLRLKCTAPGRGTGAISAAVAPASVVGQDPASGNDQLGVTFDVVCTRDEHRR